MGTSFAALVYRGSEIPDRALSQGFAVALAGWDVPAPALQIASLPGLPGYEVAFYESGVKVPRGAEDEAFDLACEVFEEELPPALGVLDAAAELGHADARVYALTYAEDIFHDDAWRFDARGFERRFVHEGEASVEAGVETPEGAEDVEVALPEGDDARAIERAVKPHRGSTFLAAELGAPALAAIVGALWATERRVAVRLVDPGAASLEAETTRLSRALKRTPGRGAEEPPAAVAGRATPAAYQAFARAYDWADPTDAADLYRGLSLGAIEGTLRFLRRDDLVRRDGDAAWKQAAPGLYPVARLTGSALGGGGPEATLALAADDDHLLVVRAGKPPVEAGPTFGELIRYLALGWSTRSEAEEDMIGALMLRARIRSEARSG
jgi:hypothetical protein